MAAEVKSVTVSSLPPLSSDENMDKFISLILSKKIKRVVFDFDSTILGLHTADILSRDMIDKLNSISKVRWFDKVEPEYPEVLEKLNELIDPSHFANGELFKLVVFKCLENNIQVSIASFGFRYVIRKYIELLFGEDQKVFSDANVLTPSDFGVEDFTEFSTHKENGKVAMLNSIIGSDVCEKTEVLFYDDSSTNTYATTSAGFNTKKVNPDTGLKTWDDYMF